MLNQPTVVDCACLSLPRKEPNFLHTAFMIRHHTSRFMFYQCNGVEKRKALRNNDPLSVCTACRQEIK